MTKLLQDLEKILSDLSHSEEALQKIKDFSESLANSQARIELFNEPDALVRAPILRADTFELGFNRDEDDFYVLQGDIITTEAAYFLGERVSDHPKYMVLNSSCDLVPERRRYAALLRLHPIRRDEADAKNKLNLLLKFKKSDAMYLPPFDEDDENVLCNAVQFDGICQMRSSDLQLARRIASLSLVGWRMFACFSRMVVARANEREAQMRTALEDRVQNA